MKEAAVTRSDFGLCSHLSNGALTQPDRKNPFQQLILMSDYRSEKGVRQILASLTFLRTRWEREGSLGRQRKLPKERLGARLRF